MEFLEDVTVKMSLGLLIVRLEEADSERSFKIAFANKAAGRATEREFTSTVGMWLGEAFPALCSRPLQTAYERALATGQPEHLGQIVHSDPPARESVFEVEAIPLDAATVAILFKNATKQFEAEARATELGRAKKKADSASKAKSEFIANLNHEIRTPMNGVMSMVHALRTTELTPRQRDCIDIIETSGEAMISLVDSVLDLSKIEAGKMCLEYADTNCRRLTRNVVRIFQQSCADKDVALNLSIDAEVPTFVSLDRNRVRQVLTNLIGNAVKFTEQGHVTVRLTANDRNARGVMLRFEISDSGIGIAEQDRERMFEPFTQVDSSATRDFEGSGLGLTISQRFVEVMAGTIGVESKIGVGSTFWFELPARLATPINADSAFTRALDGQAILAYGTSESFHHLVEDLEIYGSVVTAVNTPADFVDHLLTVDSMYTLAVVDHHTPDIQGALLGRFVRQHPSLQDIPLVLWSNSRKKETDHAQRAGFSAFVVATTPIEQVLETFASLISSPPSSFVAVGEPNEVGNGSSTLSSARVLVVEDMELNRAACVRLLESIGYNSDTARDGYEGLEAASRTRYDAILMDCQMPRLDGCETTRRIRKSEEGSDHHTPIVALTAHATLEHRQECFQAGMDAYLVKPIDPIEMQKTLAAQIWLRDYASRLSAFDPYSALRRVGGKPESLSAMAHGFLQSIPGRIDSLVRAIDAGNLVEAQKQAHGIRGAAASLSANTLRDGLRKAEEAAERGNAEALKNALPEIVREFQHVHSVFEELTKSVRNNESLAPARIRSAAS